MGAPKKPTFSTGSRRKKKPKPASPTGSIPQIPEILDPDEDGLAVSAPDGKLKAQMRARRSFLRHAPDLQGLITQDQVTAPPGAVETSYDHALMQRVAIALCMEHLKAEKEDRNADIAMALDTAGCSPEMYVQLGQHPDWDEIRGRAEKMYVLDPRWFAAQLALSQAAMHGDMPALRMYKELMAQGSLSDEEAMARLRTATPEQAMGKAKDVMEELANLLEMAHPAAPDPDLVQAAVAAAREQQTPEKAESTLDHRALHGERE